MPQLLTLIILATLTYAVVLFLISRRKRPLSLPSPDDLFYVFVIPCLNEERVLGRTLESMLSLESDQLAILVVDDGSEDATAAVAAQHDPARVWLLRRQLPEARQGKGAALNAACRHLCESDVLGRRDPSRVIVAIFDADGRVAENALREVGPHFRDPRVGAAQIGVRIRNADQNLLTRLQDFEFVVFQEIFQRARQRLGSVGLGGNGQFTRLSALRSLGRSPWSDCLTEDLDLGLRLLIGGWINSYCPTTYVSQQGVVTVRLWIRQRTRWFQGHMQCWKLIPSIARSGLLLRSSADMTWYLVIPAAIVVTPLLVVSFLVSLMTWFVHSPSHGWQLLSAHGGLIFVLWYALAFGSAPIYAYAYWLRDRTSLPRAILLAHLFNLYSQLWFLAALKALGRIVMRQGSWAKTGRVVDGPEELALACE